MGARLLDEQQTPSGEGGPNERSREEEEDVAGGHCIGGEVTSHYFINFNLQLIPPQDFHPHRATSIQDVVFRADFKSPALLMERAKKSILCRSVREGAGKAGDLEEANNKCYVPRNYLPPCVYIRCVYTIYVCLNWIRTTFPVTFKKIAKMCIIINSTFVLMDLMQKTTFICY